MNASESVCGWTVKAATRTVWQSFYRMWTKKKKDWSAEIENNQTDERSQDEGLQYLYFKHKFYPENGYVCLTIFMIIL